MDLSIAPKEIVWKILDCIRDFNDRKRASLVSKEWNWMLFNRSRAMEAVNLRICGGNPSRNENTLLFNKLYRLMVESERNYANMEFFHVNFSVNEAIDFLLFMLEVCRGSMKCLKFVGCTGLTTDDILDVVTIVPSLEELYIFNEVALSSHEEQEVCFPKLRKLGLHLSGPGDFYQHLFANAPSLEEMVIETVDSYYETYHDIDLIEKFSNNLRTLSYGSKSPISANEYSRLQFSHLTEFNLNVVGTLDCSFIRSFKCLETLNLTGKLTDELIRSVGQISTLEHLTLASKCVFQTDILNHLSHLKKLKSLVMRRLLSNSWNNINLPQLLKLQIDAIGSKFIEFLKRTPALDTLEIHDTELSNKLLKRVCHNVPNLKRLELAYCRNISDGGLRNLGQLRALTELRMWGMDVSFIRFNQWRKLPLQKLIVFSNTAIDEYILEDMGEGLSGLEQAVFYDCYNISVEAIVDLRLCLPTCEVLQVYRGDPLPPTLACETELYERNAQFPGGMLKKEMPYEWVE